MHVCIEMSNKFSDLYKHLNTLLQCSNAYMVSAFSRYADTINIGVQHLPAPSACRTLQRSCDHSVQHYQLIAAREGHKTCWSNNHAELFPYSLLPCDKSFEEKPLTTNCWGAVSSALGQSVKPCWEAVSIIDGEEDTNIPIR